MKIETVADATTDDTTETQVEVEQPSAADTDAENETSTKVATDETSDEAKDVAPAEDEVVVTIGDEAPPQEDEEIAKAPEWVRELRKTNRELSRQNKELQRQMADKAKPVEQTEVGPKPKMSDADIDYDETKYEAALSKWTDRKRAADNELVQRQATEKKAQDAWAEKLTTYGEQKTQLKAKDFTEVEAVVSDALNATQQGIIVQGADNAAVIIYALGKNSTKLKELSQITDPVKFAFAIAKLEKDLKVTTRKAPPPPEKTVTGSAPKSGVVDSQLERLRTDAERTGDYSKVTQYQRQKRKAS